MPRRAWRGGWIDGYDEVRFPPGLWLARFKKLQHGNRSIAVLPARDLSASNCAQPNLDLGFALAEYGRQILFGINHHIGHAGQNLAQLLLSRMILRSVEIALPCGPVLDTGKPLAVARTKKDQFAVRWCDQRRNVVLNTDMAHTIDQHVARRREPTIK